MNDREKVITELKVYINYPEPLCSIVNNAIELLKEQDDSKYEYHYDHTDCIWYRQGQSVDCPSTCSQYRDGWNDAMQYIFHNGKGYSPYKRKEGEVE